jgi:hypothetical protein
VQCSSSFTQNARNSELVKEYPTPSQLIAIENLTCFTYISLLFIGLTYKRNLITTKVTNTAHLNPVQQWSPPHAAKQKLSSVTVSVKMFQLLLSLYWSYSQHRVNPYTAALNMTTLPYLLILRTLATYSAHRAAPSANESVDRNVI